MDLEVKLWVFLLSNLKIKVSEFGIKLVRNLTNVTDKRKVIIYIK